MQTTLPRILVVDDDRAAASTLHRALGGEYDVGLAQSGADALATLRAGATYDAILCAMNMPGIDGAAVYQWLRRESPLQAVRFMFMADGTEQAVDFADLGARVLHKSARAPALREAVTDAVALWGRQSPQS